jgi:hypothetical protein
MTRLRRRCDPGTGRQESARVGNSMNARLLRRAANGDRYGVSQVQSRTAGQFFAVAAGHADGGGAVRGRSTASGRIRRVSISGQEQRRDVRADGQGERAFAAGIAVTGSAMLSRDNLQPAHAAYRVSRNSGIQRPSKVCALEGHSGPQLCQSRRVDAMLGGREEAKGALVWGCRCKSLPPAMA